MAQFSAQGAIIKVTISASPTAIPQVRSMKPPGVTREIADVTTLDSAGNFRQKLPLMNDTSIYTLELIWDPTNAVHDYLMDQAILATAVLDVFEITYPDTGAAKLAFSGYITKFEPDLQHGAVMNAMLEVVVTGAVVYTQ